MAATNPTKRVRPTLVQMATVWPDHAGGWTELPRVRALTASEGCGQVIGEAQLEQDTGRVALPNGQRVEQIARAPALNPDSGWRSLAASWARILLGDDAGTVRVGALTYKPIWHGIFDRPIYDPDGATVAGGTMRWSCLGIADALNRIYMWRGYEWNGTKVVDPGACPVFNDLPGGDRSAAKHDVNGVQVYTFQRGTPGTPWTARDVIEHALAAFSRGVLYGADTATAGPKWQLGTGASMLAWTVDRLDMTGRTLAELLNTLINPARGLTWRTSVSNDTVTIIVTSTNRTAVTIGSVTIPAATPVVDDLTGDLWIDQPGIQEETDYYDWITLHAARPWVSITLWWNRDDANSSIIPDGWSYYDSPSASPGQEHIWRRWKLNPTWTGIQYPGDQGFGLRSLIVYDESGTAGGRQFGNLGELPSASVLEVTRLLPHAQGFGTSKDGPRQTPLVIIGSGASSWQDVSKWVDVTPIENKAGLLLGHDDDVARFLKTKLEAGSRTLLVTVGIREWLPYTMAWRRQTTKPRDLPRILHRRMPDCDFWTGLRNTVTGVTSGGALTTAASEQSIRDDSAVMSGTLAALVARYGSEGASYAYGVDGTIDTDEGSAPGTFVSDAEVGGASIPVNATMTRRGWDFRFESYGTTYRFERLPLDVQSRP